MPIGMNIIVKYFCCFIVISLTLVSCTNSNKSEFPFKNVVFIIVDTLSTEDLGAYGNTNSPSPIIDKLAREGVLFKKAYSTSSWTKPSIASLFTGLMPSVHGVTSIDDILKEEEFTLADAFKSKGFKTAAFVSHTLISPQMGYAQGFDVYDTIPFKGNVHDVISSAKVTDMANDWLKKNHKDPFFLFLHYFDPHNNYHHHKKFDRTSNYKGSLKSSADIRELRKLIPTMTKEDQAFLKGLYQEEIAFTDSQIGRFLENIENFGLSKDTLIVLTADHGEEFLEHGEIGHSRTLYNELIHIPFILKLPSKFKPSIVNDPISSMDIFPTLLSFLKIPIDSAVKAASLALTLTHGMPIKKQDIVSEVDFKSSHIKAYKISVIRDNLKAILDKPSNTFELYDLEKDPQELDNIALKNPELLLTISPLILDYKDKVQTSLPTTKKTRKERTPDEVEQLKSLGYL